MAALRWDEKAQAFVESTNVPMRYDAESGAWVETTGMAWDEESQAWTEKWSPNNNILYLYDSGDEYVNTTGGWDKTMTYGNVNGINFSKYSDYMYGYSNGCLTRFTCSTLNKINVTNYNKLYFKWEMDFSIGSPINATMFGLSDKVDCDQEYVNDETQDDNMSRLMHNNEHPSGIVEEYLDISNVSGERYINFMCYADTGPTVMKVYKVLLEK